MPPKDRPLTKNEKKRAKKKEAKALAKEAPAPAPPTKDSVADVVEEGAPPLPDEPEDEEGAAASTAAAGVKVDYVSAEVDLADPELAEFKSIFEKFLPAEELTAPPPPPEPSKGKKDKGGTNNESTSPAAGGTGGGDTATAGGAGSAGEMEEDEDGAGGGAAGGLGRKARKKANRLSVAELKQLVNRPDVVEAHDVTSADPRLLVHLKAYRNTVPVPRHWCHKRKYLQGKRGLEKAPFALPAFIATTGIEKIRTTILEAEAAQSAKQKGRGRVAPKMGKIDIDYQVLHDAFFKFQTKPQLTHHGELYYEGKEFEVTLREKAPGALSSKLKEALAIPDGAPPPWLVNMQRYGPPPSYPNLRLPGLNAPLPPGCRFGFSPGEWGKPPVDEYGRPLYGDVFATPEEGEHGGNGANGHGGEAAVDRSHWAALGSDSEPEPESDEEEGGGDDETDGTASVDLGDLSGAATPSGMASVGGSTTGLSGMETPDSHVDLRKRAGAETPDSSLAMSAGYGDEGPKTLYTVVPESTAAVGAGQFFGADKQYTLSGAGGGNAASMAGTVDAAVLAAAGVASTAEALLSKQGGGGGGDDDDDEARKRKRKAEKEKEAKKKKYGDFKF